MQRLSIVRSLRLALVGLTFVLAAVGALGVSSLYQARQRYETALVQSSQLATAAANLTSAGIAEAEVLRDVRGGAAAGARRQVQAAYSETAGLALALARGDRASLRLVHAQIAAQASARRLAARRAPARAGAASGPLARARTFAGQLQTRQQSRQETARRLARSDSRRAIFLVAGAGLLALLGTLGLITALVGRMREQRRRLAVTIESLGDALLVTEQGSNTIATVNPRASELIPELPVGERIDSERSPLPMLADALSGETIVGHRGRTLAVTAARLGDDEDGVVWTVRDMSERARLERAKSDFVATASHELRSPLTSIKGFVELLARSPEAMSERQREFVDIILRSTDRLVDLVNDLLDVARIDAEHVEISRRPIDVGEAVREVVELMRPRIAEKHQQVGLYVAPTLPLALADAGRVRQIVANLLTNAHLYTPEGGRIHVRAQADRAWIQIAVADSGVGMTPAEAEHVYERFYRGGNGSKSPGTGLGLSIVKSLVEMHDGRIEVETRPGHGTTFRVLLPSALPGRESGRSLEAIRGRRVLVVDDEREIADLIAGQLAPLEVHTTIASNGAEALELLHGEHFDAITLDIMMPGLNGFDVLRTLREDPELSNTPIVFVSVFSARRELAGEWVVSKPIDADELRDVLSAAVSAGRSRVLVVGRTELQGMLEPGLDELGIEHEWETTGTAAARACGERRFEVALVDVGIRNPQAVLQALDLRGRRLRRSVILFTDGTAPPPTGLSRLGMEVVSVEEATNALLAMLRGDRA